jgi:hypothetical protein
MARPAARSLFAHPSPPLGERIAVIGAGPAGLTYASLVADDNTVTVFEKDATAGGAFRYAGLAPMFNDVGANPASFARYVRDMVAACSASASPSASNRHHGEPALLAPFIASWWRPARPIRSAPARWRWACWSAAPDTGRWCRDHDVAQGARLVLLPRAKADRRRLHLARQPGRSSP